MELSLIYMEIYMLLILVGKQFIFFHQKVNLIQKIETPGSKPTNLEFGDEDYKTLYLTEVETNSLI